ncbi:MAG TPA: amidase family protein [Burkholderiaceae bacterium]
MAGFAEYEDYDALGLAQLIREKQVARSEVREAAIARIEAHNVKLNAVIHKLYDFVPLNPAPPGGIFDGVPFLLKDLLSSYAGAPMNHGSRAYAGHTAGFDSELVRRYRATGVDILGKTNTPEFGLMGVTEPELHGATRNPWDLLKTPGGSSGGSGAAVASRMTPIASGGDGGGSLRIPASACGIFGFKPSRGRTPTGPLHGEIWQGACSEHILSRSVRDSAAMLDATLGDDHGAPYPVGHPGLRYLECTRTPPRKLRIGFSSASPIGTPVHADCKQAVKDAAHMLQWLGHEVEEATPGIDGDALAISYLTLYAGEVAQEIRAAGEHLRRKPRRGDFEAPTWMLGLLGEAYTASDFARAMHHWQRFGRAMGQFHQHYDLYLTPTMAFPPVDIGELQPKGADKAAMQVVNALGLGRLLKASGLVDQLARDSLAKSPFTQLANMTGQPAMSVPLYWSQSGLPIGVQFIAPMGREDRLFALAAQLEQERPWARRRPPLPQVA